MAVVWTRFGLEWVVIWMCMYVEYISSDDAILLQWTSVRPSRFSEGLGGGCLNQILARMMSHVYVYVCPKDRFMC